MIDKKETDSINTYKCLEGCLIIFDTINQSLYAKACQKIDTMNLSKEEKDIIKNTNFVLLLIKTTILRDKDHICSIQENSDGFFIGDTKIDKKFNITLLYMLCDDNDINVDKIQENESIRYIFNVKEKKRVR